jgi:hypothetical protein
MKRISSWMFAVATAACVIASMPFTAGSADDEGSAIYGVKMPPEYRQWELISVAHEGGNLNDIRAILGNDVAMEAFRDGTLPFPDGTIIARLAWKDTPSDENNAVFGRFQSFVAGPATNVQFMVKDTKRYASKHASLATSPRKGTTSSSRITHLEGRTMSHSYTYRECVRAP